MESYLSYLNQTLGLEHVILPKKTAAVATEPELVTQASDSGQARYHFQCLSERPLTAAEDELFLKIIAALKLGDADYSTAVGINMTFSPITVVFSDAAEGRGSWHSHGNCQVLQTHSVRAMLQDPQLKKECWAHLQTIKVH
ncbi:MAG: hypothetical protein IT287_05560 [Bdellovibrionaceae bacterium]|nr:hypothetical protein [Pseudobdellovibrionaceae bacterium]